MCAHPSFEKTSIHGDLGNGSAHGAKRDFHVLCEANTVTYARASAHESIGYSVPSVCCETPAAIDEVDCNLVGGSSTNRAAGWRKLWDHHTQCTQLVYSLRQTDHTLT